MSATFDGGEDVINGTKDSALPQFSTPMQSPNNGKTEESDYLNPTLLRRALYENGYSPLPAQEKSVLLSDWPSLEITKARIAEWADKPRWNSTGIRCDSLIAIDIDVLNEGLCEEISKFAAHKLGNGRLIRRGAEPKVLLLYGRDFPLKKRTLTFNYEGEDHKVELLADGQQFIAFGIHPDTKKPYKWLSEDNPLSIRAEELENVDEDALTSFLSDLEALLTEKGCKILSSATDKSLVCAQDPSRSFHIDYLAAALEWISSDDYDTWIKVGMALHYETRGSAEGLELWDKWSQESPKYNESRDSECAYHWEKFQVKPNPLTGATIIKFAQEEGFDSRAYIGPKVDHSDDFVALPTFTETGCELQAKPQNPPSQEKYPSSLLNPPGLVGKVAEFTNRLSYRHQPLLAICAGLLTVASLSRNTFHVSPWGTTLNLNIVAVAETGEGKEAPRKAIKAAHQAVNAMSSIREAVASGPALVRALKEGERNSLTLLLDEFGRFLSAARIPNNGHQYELVSEIMRMYGMANSTYTGKAYADTKNNVPPIKHPFLNLFGTTTKRSLTEALSSRDVVDGTLNRLLVVITDERQPAFNDDAKSEIPAEVVDALKRLLALDEFGQPKNGESESFIEIPTNGDAKEQLLAFRDEADARRVACQERGALWARGHENAVKIAGILAVGNWAINEEADLNIIINRTCAEWAISFVSWCLESLDQLAEAEMGDNETHRTIRQILSYVRQVISNPTSFTAKQDLKFRGLNQDGWVGKSQITKRFQNVPRLVREDALTTLLESGELLNEQRDRCECYRLVVD